MKREFNERLCSNYPTLYRKRNGDPNATCMYWGFECGAGWYTLIDVISELLVKHDTSIRAQQVKEKLGGLNFYHSHCSDYSISVQMTAELVSKAVCEECGAPAFQQNYDGWYATLCKEHRKCDAAVKENDVDISDVQDLNLGYAWLRLAAILMRLANFNTKHNGMLAAKFEISKVQNGRFDVRYSGGDDKTRGMVDLIIGYANRIDEHSGHPK